MRKINLHGLEDKLPLAFSGLLTLGGMALASYTGIDVLNEARRLEEVAVNSQGSMASAYAVATGCFVIGLAISLPCFMMLKHSTNYK